MYRDYIVQLRSGQTTKSDRGVKVSKGKRLYSTGARSMHSRNRYQMNSIDLCCFWHLRDTNEGQRWILDENKHVQNR